MLPPSSLFYSCPKCPIVAVDFLGLLRLNVFEKSPFEQQINGLVKDKRLYK